MYGIIGMTWTKLLLMLLITEIKGLKELRSSEDSSASERTMRTIMKSCYGNVTSSHPIIVFGDFNSFMNEVPFIQINEFLNITYYGDYQSLNFKVSNVVLIGDLRGKLESRLKLLKKTKLWNHLIPFFAVSKNASCDYAKEILAVMWKMEILNSVYICSESVNNTSALYTLNPIANYAPYPWKRIEQFNKLNIFNQNFDANISCTNLIFDKTKILNGYEITIMDTGFERLSSELGENYFDAYAEFPAIPYKAHVTMIRALNASSTFEVDEDLVNIKKRYFEGSIDILMDPYPIHAFKDMPYLLPIGTGEMIAVVKLKAEVSTLEKIYQLWSTPVLIAAAIAIVILFLILMIKEWSFGLALLDVTRLLVYTSVQTHTNHQSFRIYFTTMLIFMVISNGVFQGKIAAFLTTRERGSAPKSVNELIELGYQMYVFQRTRNFAKRNFPECEFKEVIPSDCINLVLHGTKNLCAISKRVYEAKYILLSLDYAREPVNVELVNFKCRQNWPLRDRYNNMITRIVESGLMSFWQMQKIGTQKYKRLSIQAEWSSPDYQPVKRAKLKFAFQLLAVGLSISTVTFFLELLWIRYKNHVELNVLD